MNWNTGALLLIGWLSLAGEALAQEPGNAGAGAAYRSHPPSRPLPAPRPVLRGLVEGAKRFVDATRGDDTDSGAEAAPWRTLGHALRQLQPGDTLYLRGGTYYERVSLGR